MLARLTNAMSQEDSRQKSWQQLQGDSGAAGAGEVTALLADVERGDLAAADRLLPLVYAELRRLADRYLTREAPDHTLQPTALVHEAYIRLVEPGCQVAWQDRSHFVAVAARAMRQILVNHAISRRRQKRGGNAKKIALDQIVASLEERSIDLIALDEALCKLADVDPLQSQIVELRFFAGLAVRQTARVLGISPRTVDRESLIAKGWLHREISKGD
jgi:RNA polymerase sigma-70 factor (ECF subfamily)